MKKAIVGHKKRRSVKEGGVKTGVKMVQGWKILTSDFRPPIQGGEPLFTGIYPHTLPTVTLDTSNLDCAAGWNYTATLAGAIKRTGLWRTGRPNAMMLVEPSSDWIERGNKRRASGLTLVPAATDGEIQSAILDFSSVFGARAMVMAEEQWLWFQALGRPQRNQDAVIAGLQSALSARGLDWVLKEFPSSAWAAWAALTVQFAARSAWVGRKSDLLTVIRDAYLNGLELAIPTGQNELGWSMVL